jgi:hypothetical protein
MSLGLAGEFCEVFISTKPAGPIHAYHNQEIESDGSVRARTL